MFSVFANCFPLTWENLEVTNNNIGSAIELSNTQIKKGENEHGKEKALAN